MIIPCYKEPGLKSQLCNYRREQEATEQHLLSHSPKEYVVDLLTNERSQAEKFAVDPMQDGLEAVSFAWIFAVK